MALRGELLRGQREGRDHLLGQVLGVREAVGVEHDLADEGVVRHHHRHGPEEGGQIVRQLGAARVARVHRDEDVERRPHHDQRPFELKLRFVVIARQLRLLAEEDEELLRDDREHLDVDAVELVEAAPGAREGEALEELPDHDVVLGCGQMGSALMGVPNVKKT